jgi:hypothetical protein
MIFIEYEMVIGMTLSTLSDLLLRSGTRDMEIYDIDAVVERVTNC